MGATRVRVRITSKAKTIGRRRAKTNDGGAAALMVRKTILLRTPGDPTQVT